MDTLSFWIALCVALATWGAQAIVNWRFKSGLKAKFPQMFKLFGGEEAWVGDDYWMQWGVISMLLAGSYIGVGPTEAEKYIARYSFAVVFFYFASLFAGIAFLGVAFIPTLIDKL